MDAQRPKLVPVDFSQLDGWAEDDHAAAFRAFLKSCRVAPRRDAACTDALATDALALGETLDAAAARTFFEGHFVPHVVEAKEPGLVTGYYEPEVRGAYKPGDRFQVPLYGRPDDLITRADETERARFNDRVTGFRATPDGEMPYHTRAEIEAGALQDRGLELLYLDDAVDLFYMQVQGSGLVRLDDGTAKRLTYAGKNGHPYTSIGKVLIARGELGADDIDMDRVKAWLRADPERGRALMQENLSYVFFRVLSETEARDGPLGAAGVSLTPGRSLAIDTAHHGLGTPVFVTTADLNTDEGQPFRRLMIGQDVGSAISGSQRGDIFWGTGEGAGAIAGRTRHKARFHALLPKR